MTGDTLRIGPPVKKSYVQWSQACTDSSPSVSGAVMLAAHGIPNHARPGPLEADIHDLFHPFPAAVGYVL